MFGNFDDFAGHDSSEYSAGLLPKLPYAYPVTHGVHTVAQTRLGACGALVRRHQVRLMTGVQPYAGALEPEATASV